MGSRKELEAIRKMLEQQDTAVETTPAP
jgi:hypothetical protein